MSVTSSTLGAAWAAVLAAALLSRHPGRGHVRRDLAPGAVRRRRSPATAVGLVALALGGRLTGAPVACKDARRVGRALLASAASCALVPAAAPGVGALVWALPALRDRRRRRDAEAAVRRQLPEVVELFALVSTAGLSIPLAVAAVARRAGRPIGDALAGTVRATAGGRRLADALGDLPAELGEGIRPLVGALVASIRDGSPLGAVLDRLAGELRHDRRRRAEALARRVPVKLLFPLVACILPAFALLTVAPLLAGALSALRP